MLTNITDIVIIQDILCRYIYVLSRLYLQFLSTDLSTMDTLVVSPVTMCPATVALTTLDATANVSLVLLASGYSTDVLNMVNKRPRLLSDRFARRSGGSDRDPVVFAAISAAFKTASPLGSVIT